VRFAPPALSTRRQIGAFHLAGKIFGWRTVRPPVYPRKNRRYDSTADETMQWSTLRKPRVGGLDLLHMTRATSGRRGPHDAGLFVWFFGFMWAPRLTRARAASARDGPRLTAAGLMRCRCLAAISRLSRPDARNGLRAVKYFTAWYSRSFEPDPAANRAAGTGAIG